MPRTDTHCCVCGIAISTKLGPDVPHYCCACRGELHVYQPTPEQIAAACAEIFATTPPEEYSRRALLGNNDRRTITGIATERKGWALNQGDMGVDWTDAKRERRRKKA